MPLAVTAILPPSSSPSRPSARDTPVGGALPFNIRWDSEAGVVLGVATGELNAEDARTGVTVLAENPQWTQKPVVWDFRLARFDIRPAEVRELARFVVGRAPSKRPPRVAFVTGRDPDFGLARMYEMLTEQPTTEVRVFRDYDEAVAWARSVEGPHP
jgi:hypothetical protein